MSCCRLGLALLAGWVLFAPGFGYAQEDAEKAKSKFDQLIDKKKKVEGLWTIYHGDQQLLVDFSADALKKEYIVIPSISKGISQGMVLGGMSWGFGDDAIWAFKKTDDKLFIIQRNVRFRAKANSPEASAVELAYSDSILYSLPILTKSPSGGSLVDLTSVFMNDELQIGGEIGPGFRFAADRSTISKVKAFSENVELQINAVYQGMMPIVTVPNPRGVQVGVHYSLSVLPSIGSNGYKPRVADDRVGYFLTAIKDFSNRDEPDHFVRYVNRWHLEKLDNTIDVSPPKEPIRFYIENTVPVFLRPTVEAGILEWNKAFEPLGFAGAIKVDQQPADPNFDPENVRYNTFRWMTAEAGFAMGPSRVDPRTGQILDADIIFDAKFLDSWSARWETFRNEDPKAVGMLEKGFEAENDPLGLNIGHRHAASCNYCREMQHQNGFAAAFFMATGAATDGGLPKEFVHEGLKEVVMHEVGHTLGLRHNFKASAWKSLKDINDKESGRTEGTIASVMDYAPPNISIDPKDQGLYYSQTIGPYDYWAIEYGYRPFASNEAEGLKKITARSSEPALRYSTDEDTRYYDPDPLSNRFDLGDDPLAYSRRQMELTTAALPKIIERTVKDGEGYQRARQAFVLLFSEYWRAALFAARFPGGIDIQRAHKTEKDPVAPLRVIDAAKQREAMELVAKSAFAPPPVDGKQLNYLAVSRWSHWGVNNARRLDYPIHNDMLAAQDEILGLLLSSTTLERILDNEFKTSGDDDVYTLAEHLGLIIDSIFAEWSDVPEDKEFDNRSPLVDSFRRNLQRQAIRRAGMAVSYGSGAPSDARTLLRMHLQNLRDQGQELLDDEDVSLDDYTRAHLLDSVARIDAVLNAELALPSIN